MIHQKSTLYGKCGVAFGGLVAPVAASVVRVDGIWHRRWQLDIVKGLMRSELFEADEARVNVKALCQLTFP